eukprot:174906_1
MHFFKVLKIWKIMLCVIITLICGYFYRIVKCNDFAHLNTNTVAIVHPNRSVIRAVNLSWIRNPEFIQHNIKYITLDNNTQWGRFNTLQHQTKRQITVNESFIINNWMHLDLEDCKNHKYSSLEELYDTRYINFHHLPNNICKWEYATNRKVNSKVFDTDSFAYIRKSVKLQDFVMNELFLKYGIICVLRAGELMGAFRDGGHFPWEKSSDHWCILPRRLSVQCFHALNFKLIQNMNELEHSNGNVNANNYNDGDSASSIRNKWKYYNGKAWENYLRSYGFFIEYESFWTDGTLIDFEVIINSKFNALFHQRFAVKPIDYFNDRNMCLCNYSGTIAFAFEAEEMHKYLSITYDADYMNPHPNYKGSIEKIKGYEISSFVLWEEDHEKAQACQLNVTKCFVKTE